ncbi:TraR/DksA C4-type zinc finger protein [Candidatus Kaiserbacteria bacterium]|nr:TraR/DksA C4-type zinc finger protein [Candidatus Kaiserbacteria bacterium]
MEIDTAYFKTKLEQELRTLTHELTSIAEKNPENPKDWEAKGGGLDIQQADPNERADAIEEYETNVGVLKEVEVRYNDVKAALKRIEDGTYGVCEAGGEPIEKERLEANPAATTCTKHMN